MKQEEIMYLSVMKNQMQPFQSTSPCLTTSLHPDRLHLKTRLRAWHRRASQPHQPY